MSGFSKGLGLD